MRYLSRALVAGGLGFAVSLIAACGGGAGLLSGGQASGLNSQLDRVSSALAAGQCGAVQSGTRSLVNGVSNLPSTVNTTLRQDLSQGASTVSQLAAQQCTQSTATAATTTTPTTTASTTATTTTATTATSTTTTTPPTTTTSATTPPTTGTTTGPSGGGALSGGSGGGLAGNNGNGNG